MIAEIIRVSLPSKGRLAEDTLDFLAACGLRILKPNPRQYEASIPALPGIIIIFQRPADIVVSVREGSVDFGITGMDVIQERRGNCDEIIILHDTLGYGHCSLTLAVPESWDDINDMEGLATRAGEHSQPLRVATKYPSLTGRFLVRHQIPHLLISAEGTLETAPAIGYADMISDLVSSGQTLRDNRLKPISDGVIQKSQAALIANFQRLKSSNQALSVARNLLEYMEAHLRATENIAIFANVRGESPQDIAAKLFSQKTIGGLQGPTISKVLVRDGASDWYAIHIVVRRSQLFAAIDELRLIGGSGVVVTPVSYIFEEEPPRYTAMLRALENNNVANS